MEEALYYTAEEVASFMRLNERTIRNMGESGELPGARKFGRQWRFERDTLERYLGRPLPEPSRKSEA